MDHWLGTWKRKLSPDRSWGSVWSVSSNCRLFIGIVNDARYRSPGFCRWLCIRDRFRLISCTILFIGLCFGVCCKLMLSFNILY